MAGVTDRAFRETAVSFGAAYTATEMISAKGVEMGNKESLEMLKVEKNGAPIAVQLFGNSATCMAAAAAAAAEFSPDFIDINMGCPAPKIVKGGSGSALMKEPELACEIVRAVSESVNIPVTVKIRKGWDSQHENAVQLAAMLEQAGAAAITVHGRTRQEMFSGTVDYEVIRRVKDAVKIPVIGNGDITDEASAAKMLEKTGCDAIMIGRGAFGNPWLFARINAYLNTSNMLLPPTINEKAAVMLKHIEKAVKYKGEKIAMKEARRQAAYYTKGIKGGAHYRRLISGVETYDALVEITYKMLKENL